MFLDGYLLGIWVLFGLGAIVLAHARKGFDFVDVELFRRFRYLCRVRLLRVNLLDGINLPECIGLDYRFSSVVNT